MLQSQRRHNFVIVINRVRKNSDLLHKLPLRDKCQLNASLKYRERTDSFMILCLTIIAITTNLQFEDVIILRVQLLCSLQPVLYKEKTFVACKYTLYTCL